MEEGVKAVVYLGKASNVQNNQNVLVKGAIIYETDTNKLKISDGNTSVRKLKYLPFSQITATNITNWNKMYSDFYNGAGSFTETDPTVPNHVKAITALEINNWNTAFGWGDHSTQGYLTSFSETDPTVPAAVKAISNTQITNWDTAFSWGNHASAGYLTSFSETDPTVGAHIKAILSGDITNWNNAFAWGNHASVGYLTSFTETDPTVPAAVKAITSIQISNWDTAFGWGNHASAGYITGYTETDPIFVASAASAIITGDITNWNDGLLNRKGGNFYRRAGRWYTQADNASALTAVNHATPSIFFVGFAVERTITIDALAVEVTTAGSAGSVARMGIYNGDISLCQPTTLIVDSGTFAVSTTGTKTVVLGSTITLQPGLYFTALSTGSTTAHQFRSLVAGNFAQIIGTTAAGGNQLGSYINGTRAAFGALPADASTLTTLTPTVGSIYCLWYRLV